MSAEYTPTTEEVRRQFTRIDPPVGGFFTTVSERWAMFDSWLAAYTADVQAKALREAADDWHAEHTGTYPRPHRWLHARADALAPTDNEGGQ